MTTTLRLSLLLTLLTVTAYYAVLHARVLQIGHPITQDEPGFIEITAAGNPYTLAGMEACGNVYGPGYALWARPFTAVFTNPYLAHRWASSSALFLMLGLLAWVLRREGLGGIETAAGVGVVYILNVSSHSLTASADLLGAALYVAALAVSRRGTWPALLGGLVLVTLAALTKAYFALGWVIIGSQLLLFGPPRRAVAYLGVSGLVSLVTVGLLQAFAPYYFLSTLVVHRTASARVWNVLLSQTAEFALLTAGLLLLVLLRRPAPRRVTLASGQPPVSPALDLWDWAALLATGALLASLGWHPGNYLVYYYHLLLVPLVIVALRRLSDWPRAGRLLLCANLLILGWYLPPLPGPDHWADLKASVAGVHGPILAEPLLEPFARAQPNVELMAHGQTPSILQALDQLGPAVPDSYAGLHRDLLRLADAQAARIRAGEFAAIYVSYHGIGGGTVWSYDQRHVLQPLFERYRPADEILIYPYGTPYWNRLRHGEFPYHVTKWVPKLPPAAPAAGARP